MKERRAKLFIILEVALIIIFVAFICIAIPNSDKAWTRIGYMIIVGILVCLFAVKIFCIKDYLSKLARVFIIFIMLSIFVVAVLTTLKILPDWTVFVGLLAYIIFNIIIEAIYKIKKKKGNNYMEK